MFQQEIDKKIKEAMLAKNESRLRGLRAIKSALLLAKTEKGASADITDDTKVKVLQKLVKQRKESAEIYKAQKRDDLYTIEMEELAVIEEFMPGQMSEEEVKQVVQQVITATGAASVKDMGKVMAAANKEIAGRADGKTISQVVKQLLS